MPNVQEWFEALWALREEQLYPSFFGGQPSHVQNLPVETFAALGVETPDPRFLTHLSLQFSPTARRPHTLYVTSGMSNPWGQTPETVDPNGFSGLGFEFALHTREPATWAPRLLHWLMAVQLLVATGHLKGELLEPFDLIPLGGPLAGSGELTHLLMLPAPTPEEVAYAYPQRFTLPSGHVDLLLVFGVTGREVEFLKSQGPEPLLALLRHREFYPLTDPARASGL